LDTEKKPTIGIGHYLTNTQQDRDLFKSLFGNAVNYDAVLKGKQKLTDDQIEKLFNVDVKVKERLASSKISNFSSFPQYIKNAIINAFYRGDMGSKTIKLMNSGNWGAAAKEYLNHQNARSGPDQIQRRMKTNALAFAQYAKNKNEYFGFNYAIG
jgi:GH24 family phage-related lysozyme (muramidase)